MSTVEPSAQGTLERTPLAHLLVYVLDKGLTGTLQFESDTSHASLLVQDGGVLKVRTSDPVAYLGDVLLGLGVITAEAHAEAVGRTTSGGGLIGAILLEMGAVTPENLLFGLHVQVEQKLQHLFDLPPGTAFAYYDGMNGLVGFGGDEPVMVDPYRVMWWGMCRNPQWEHCDATVGRIGDAGLALAAHAQPERLFFGGPEVAAVELMRARPLRPADLAAAQILPEGAVQLFFYCLLITKQVDVVDVQAQAPAPRPPVPAGPAAVGRMKLQTRPAFRPQPLAVEEHAALKAELLERADKLGGQDYFQMLGVEQAATKDDIQRAYLKLAKTWHPDRLPAPLAGVKDVCAKLFAHLSEAQAALLDDEKRAKYLVLIKEGGGTKDEQDLVQTLLAAAAEFQKADYFLKKNDLFQAEMHVRKAHQADPEQADYLALLTWLEAQKSQYLGKEKTLEKIALLDKAIKLNANCERAYFYRAMLFKRANMPREAIRDLKRCVEINPKSLDAARELRLIHIRKEGPATAGGPAAKRKEEEESLGGLFGKLFKK
jgi:curved DNA-binding protein CbpA